VSQSEECISKNELILWLSIVMKVGPTAAALRDAMVAALSVG
jgi:hypothetical protein